MTLPQLGSEARSSANQLRSRHIQRMIDQWRHPFDESHRMGQRGVKVERLLVCPARVNVEQPRISDRTKSVNAQAAGFLAGRAHNSIQRLRDSTLIARAGVKTGEYEQLHGPPPDNHLTPTLLQGYFPDGAAAVCDPDAFRSPAFSSSKLNCLPTASYGLPSTST